jgi:phenylpropionate dioxygenase-like ring-hydroxylating dioxygenase large terminal subunit
MSTIEHQEPPVEEQAATGALRAAPGKLASRYFEARLGLRNYWYPALMSRDLKRKPVGATMLGEELVFVRQEGKTYCLEGRCAHRGVPLTEGRFEFPCTISCAYHGWTYSLETGELLAALTDGPESKVVGKVRLRTYPTQERQGVVWVFIGDIDPPPLEEDVPSEFLSPDVAVEGQVRVASGNWRLAIEGSLDSSHAFYLHRPAWIMAFTQLQAFKGQYWVEIEGNRFVGYKTETPIPYADYPGLGRWPRRPWYKTSRRRVVKYIGWLPGASKVEHVLRDATVFSWFVPIDAERVRWFQFLVAPHGRLGKLYFKLKYILWWRWLYQGQFLGQDARVLRLMHPFYAEQDGWAKERLYRPDIVITTWRKFVSENARGIQPDPRA